MTDAVETMFSARGRPWHGLGEVVKEAPNVREAIKLAGLDWVVERLPVVAKRQTDDGVKEIELDGYRAIVRASDDSVFQVASDQYTPVQNETTFEAVDLLLDQDDLRIETAGSLRGGKLVFLTVELPHTIQVQGEDVGEVFIVLLNSHDSSLSWTAMVTPVLVVCLNTARLALSQAKSKFTLRHTESIDGRIAEVRDALGLSYQYVDEYNDVMEQLAAKEFDKPAYEKMVKEVFPGKTSQFQPFTEEQYGLIGVFESSPNIQDGLRYTRYGALQAANEWLNWGKDVRASKKKSEDERRTERAWGLTGDVVPKSTRVMKHLLDA